MILSALKASGLCVALCLPARTKCLRMKRKPQETTSCLDYEHCLGLCRTSKALWAAMREMSGNWPASFFGKADFAGVLH
ncbi:uncharacterized [Lates japonicus]